MLGFLKGLRRSKPGFDAPLLPDEAFVAIGDVHGRDDLLVQLLTQIDRSASDLPLVFVGDLVDRGPDSSGVVSRVMSMCEESPENVICLKGNHEAMMLDFVDVPSKSGHVWLRNGGDKTLESFGIEPPANLGDEDILERVRDALLEHVGCDLIHWLRTRPLIWQSGNVAVTHAGGDPAQTLESRRGHGLLWGHRDFLRKTRTDGLWMVHGHYASERASAQNGRISVDTGAYASGTLSAAVIAPGKVEFLST